MKKLWLFLAIGTTQFASIEPAKAPDQDQKKSWDEISQKTIDEKWQELELNIKIADKLKESYFEGMADELYTEKDILAEEPLKAVFYGEKIPHGSPDYLFKDGRSPELYDLVMIHREDKRFPITWGWIVGIEEGKEKPYLVALYENGKRALRYYKKDDLAQEHIYTNLKALTEEERIIWDMYEKRGKARQAHEALVKPGILPSEAGDIISQYLGAQPAQAERKIKTDEDVAQDIKKGYEEDPVITQEIAHAKAEQEKSQLNRLALLAAITHDDMKQFQENITPFSINGIQDFSTQLTPLMQSAKLGRDEMVAALLNYQGTIRRTRYHIDTVRADVGAVDKHGDTALMIAIQYKNFAIALMIAQKMKSSELAIINKKNLDAYDLAIKYQYDQEKNANYQELMKILSAARKELEVNKKMEEVD